jgi:hypothetical protein
LDNLDEEGQTELYHSILALLSKESENELDLGSEEDSGEHEEEALNLNEAGETEVVQILPQPVREHDAANITEDRTTHEAAGQLPVTPAPAVITVQAAGRLRSAAERVQAGEEEEDDTDSETKKLLEDAAAESSAKRYCGHFFLFFFYSTLTDILLLL